MATAGTPYSTMQSLAAQMAKSSNETHTVSPLDELMALKTSKDMAADKNDEALWQQYGFITQEQKKTCPCSFAINMIVTEVSSTPFDVKKHENIS